MISFVPSPRGVNKRVFFLKLDAGIRFFLILFFFWGGGMVTYDAQKNPCKLSWSNNCNFFFIYVTKFTSTIFVKMKNFLIPTKHLMLEKSQFRFWNRFFKIDYQFWVSTTVLLVKTIFIRGSFYAHSYERFRIRQRLCCSAFVLFEHESKCFLRYSMPWSYLAFCSKMPRSRS